jgi:hypothetical protein
VLQAQQFNLLNGWICNFAFVHVRRFLNQLQPITALAAWKMGGAVGSLLVYHVFALTISTKLVLGLVP